MDNNPTKADGQTDALGTTDSTTTELQAAAEQPKGIQDLSEEHLLTLSKALLRAVAHDRGYEIGDGGRRVLVARFLVKQSADPTVAKATA